MKVQLLKNAFRPDGSKTPDILKKGTVVDLPTEQAEKLIGKGVAADVSVKPEASKEPKVKKEKAVKIDPVSE